MKKVISGGGRTLPEEIIAYVVLPRLPVKSLIRLPVKSLIRFQCVSQRWCALISTDPNFMRLQDAHARSSPALLLFGETPRPVFLSRREESNPARSIGFPRIFRQPQFSSPHGNWLPLAACRGILCIAITPPGSPVSALYLGNPVWMDWRALPEPPIWGPLFYPSRMQLTVYDTPCGTVYKLVVPFLMRSGTAGQAETAFLVFSSAKGSWEKSGQRVLLKQLHSQDAMSPFYRNVCVEGIFFWDGRNEVLWCDPRDERGGAIPLPFTDADRLLWKIGEWDGKLSFVGLVNREIHMWSWNRSSWSFSILLAIGTVAKAYPDFFASMGLRMDLRNRRAESLDVILDSIRPSIAAFGAGFIVLSSFLSLGLVGPTGSATTHQPERCGN